jgi:hypothetical protein
VPESLQPVAGTPNSPGKYLTLSIRLPAATGDQEPILPAFRSWSPGKGVFVHRREAAIGPAFADTNFQA